jgi:ethanolamine utilization protein EutN
VQPLKLDGSNRGDAVVALDAIGAGIGDKVLLTTDGYAAMSSVGRMQSPIDMAVIGFIDKPRNKAHVWWASKLAGRNVSEA